MMNRRLYSLLPPAWLVLFFGLFFLSPVFAAETLRASRTEFAVGETATVEIPGALGLMKPKWSASPEGVAGFKGSVLTYVQKCPVLEVGGWSW